VASPLAAYVASLRADRTRLLESFVKLYNGAGDYARNDDVETDFMPYRSTLTWDRATQAFVQPAGAAFAPNLVCSHILGNFGWRARHASVRNGFRVPDRVNGAPVATVGAVRAGLFGLPSS
jgi:hypothetical protein